MSEVQTEQVLVVPTERFHSLGHFQGFSAKPELLEQLLLAEHTSYRSRDAVEEDPSFKQLIPYCLFRHTDAEGTAQAKTPPAGWTLNASSTLARLQFATEATLCAIFG